MIDATFSSGLFIKNRFKLKQLIHPNSCVILWGSDEKHRNGDQYYPYRQDSDFFYLTGIEQEKSVLVLFPDHPEEEKKEVLFILRPKPELETWEGRKLRPSDASKQSGIETIRYLEDLDGVLQEFMVFAAHIYLHTTELPKFIPEVPSRNERMGETIHRRFPLHEYHRLSPLLQKLRAIKEPQELAAIRQAIQITSEGFYHVLQSVQPGMSERELEALLTYSFISKGASGHAFSPIVASGINACSLHYTKNNAVIGENHLVLMDFGAEFGNYAADCSRTIPANGTFSPRQRELYEGLLDIFYKARELMKPGNSMADVNAQTKEWMEDFHVAAGLYSQHDLTGKNGETLYLKYYMHGTGHSMGLDVHDPLDKHETFQPGMIFTCEPGIYIEAEGIGIRIENDILITENGHEDLMAGMPITAADIEKKMRRTT